MQGIPYQELYCLNCGSLAIYCSGSASNLDLQPGQQKYTFLPLYSVKRFLLIGLPAIIGQVFCSIAVGDHRLCCFYHLSRLGCHSGVVVSFVACRGLRLRLFTAIDRNCCDEQQDYYRSKRNDFSTLGVHLLTFQNKSSMFINFIFNDYDGFRLSCLWVFETAVVLQYTSRGLYQIPVDSPGSRNTLSYLCTQ